MSPIDFYRPSFFPRTLFMHRIGSPRVVTLGFYRIDNVVIRHTVANTICGARQLEVTARTPYGSHPEKYSRVASNKTQSSVIRNRSLSISRPSYNLSATVNPPSMIPTKVSHELYEGEGKRRWKRRGGGWGRKRAEGERCALILGQRPTSPKGAQCYVGPLAHCGSHCCANCITTGSGRDLSSVARNSVSRGLAPALTQCNSNSTTQPTPTSDVARATTTL